jgi:hypothetical protein
MWHVFGCNHGYEMEKIRVSFAPFVSSLLLFFLNEKGEFRNQEFVAATIEKCSKSS